MESLDEETWDEEAAHQKDRRDTIIFWLVAIICAILVVSGMMYKESMQNRLDAEIPDPVHVNATSTPTATPGPRADIGVFPDPQAANDNFDTATYNFDRNQDGVVDEEEAKYGYKTFDINNDGTIDAKELLDVRAALRHTNVKLLEKIMDSNKDGKVSVGERWQVLQAFDANHDGELSARELKTFWQDFIKKHYLGTSWELLSGDAPQAEEAVDEYVRANTKDGWFEIEGFHLKRKESQSKLADIESMVVVSICELEKRESKVQVSFFLQRKGANWAVSKAWISQPPPFRCPKHPDVISPVSRLCPFDDLPMKR